MSAPAASPATPRGPSRAVLAAVGAALVPTLVLFAAAFRDPVDAWIDPDDTSAAAPPLAPAPTTATPTATATATASAPPDDAPAGTAAPSVYEPRSRFTRDVRTGHLADAANGLETILGADAAALEDPEIRGAILDLALRLAVVGDREADRVFDLVANRTGARGPDLLFALVTTKGGSRAAKRAEDMLRDETLRVRGTPALRVAYDLRASRCGDKPSLFERAATEGDARALGQLTMLNQDCRSRWRRTTECCFPRDPALVAAIEQLRTRVR